jgi:hypothetical protein
MSDVIQFVLHIVQFHCVRAKHIAHGVVELVVCLGIHDGQSVDDALLNATERAFYDLAKL